MPRRTDIGSILIIGSGPIVIGQACEFDYSGTQACKALREEGYRVILANSNPATIMTDPEFSDVTYIEPLTPEVLEKIIAKERPDALLPTLGGQTGLNLARTLARNGTLEKHGVELIGAKLDAIEKGEDRKLFREAMQKIGLDLAKSYVAHSLEEAREGISKIGNYPFIIRPSYTLGGAGGGIAYNREEFETIVSKGLELSPANQVLIEECLLGWKEYEMEVMRDKKDHCVIICSIENVDPMGIHTGDSITVAPAMTLTDKEFQLMRDASFACIREVGVETGGSNIQFAVNPDTGRMVIIEMNPRVSRSSALASKATGFPIAKIAAKLAVGYTLDELPNDITKKTPACFEPTIDYIVTKIPRFTFEKFPNSDPTLTSSMKSVGEAMAIGTNFKTSYQKALRSLEIGSNGFGGGGRFGRKEITNKETIRKNLSQPNAERPFFIRYAFKNGFSVDEIHIITGIDRWFLEQFKELHLLEDTLASKSLDSLDTNTLRHAKESGFTDLQIGNLLNIKPELIESRRKELGIETSYRLVDTCAAEFEAQTPYYYSSFGGLNETQASKNPKILIIGGGPNRIGQGIEFDYCCVHASLALQEIGFDSVMVNSNPETVSTDYDISDRLYFEPLTLEDVLNIYREEGCAGAIVQFGGQTPLNLAAELKAHGVNIIGTSPESIALAEDRKHFKEILQKIDLRQPENRIAHTPEQAYEMAGEIGFPILLRPSFVLGGRGMFIVYEMDELKNVVRQAFDAAPGKPVLLDKFLENAIELDVDCISDGETTVIGGMLEHIEHAGIHSGDATMVLPPHTLSESMLEEVRQATYSLAKELKVIGLMNVQFAIKDDLLYVLEVNPRASRTIPFISKAINTPLAKLAAQIMTGKTLAELGFTTECKMPYWAVKASVFPFARFPGTTILLSPEMRSTGEVMGIDENLELALAKAYMAAGPPLPLSGSAFICVKDADKYAVTDLAKELDQLNFKLYATAGTAEVLEREGLHVERLHKLSEGRRPHAIDMIKNDELSLIINTPDGAIPMRDENEMRALAISSGVCMITNLKTAYTALGGIRAMHEHSLDVKPLQIYAEKVEKR